jgi:hypothetical protein
MQRLWDTSDELKVLVLQLDPVSREAAKRLARLLGPVSSRDPMSAHSQALELLDRALMAGLIANRRPVTDIVLLTDEQYTKSLLVGIGIAQWYAEAQSGRHWDQALFELVSDSAAFDRESSAIAESVSAAGRQAAPADLGARPVVTKRPAPSRSPNRAAEETTASKSDESGCSGCMTALAIFGAIMFVIRLFGG